MWGQGWTTVMNWGPWGPTTHGTGMVTPVAEQKFRAQGVRLVDLSSTDRVIDVARVVPEEEGEGAEEEVGAEAE